MVVKTNIAKKEIHEIETPSAKKVLTKRKQAFEKVISVNGCNGSSDLGQLTSAVANAIRDKVPNAFVACPYSLFPEVEGPSQVLLHSDHHIVIDGCGDRCLTRTLERAGLKVDLSYAMDEDFGFEKHPQPAKFTQEQLDIVVKKITEDINNLDIIRHPKKLETTAK